MGKQHQLISQQMKSELEEPLSAFSGGMKERRKIVQTGVERLFKTKQAQTEHVNKSKNGYEKDCLKIKGYLAQGHMVMGQEERKNKAKLEKTQINMATNSNEYESAVRVLEETTGRWNKEWKAACDKFQDLEEERLDFTKSSLWTYANIASTVCVTDDAACEKIRLSLENCEVEKDIQNFIRTYGTGQEIPDAPKYVNFGRGDIDSASEVSEDEGYTVAQFQRSTKPEFRSASPSHSIAGSTAPPQSELAQRINEGPHRDEDDSLHRSNSGRPPPLNYRPQDPHLPPEYSPSQHGDIPNVPHNQYPTEGMTMYCRAGPPSVNGSAISANTRPSSRDDHSEVSAPSSFTSADPMSGKSSPVKGRPAGGVQLPGMGSSPEKSIQKKRSGFFSNSPFRRKSKREPDHQPHASNRNTWNPTSPTKSETSPMRGVPSGQQSIPTKYTSDDRPASRNVFRRDQPPEGEEAADPRASFQLNVGNNVFDVASPDSYQSTPRASVNNRRGFANSRANSSLASPTQDLSMDPVAQALADLKSGSAFGMSKQASMRVQADRLLGVQSPNPDAQSPTRPGAISAASADRLIAPHRGTPPPAYEGGAATPGRSSALGVPQPAFTSREMRSRTENWGANGATSPTRPAMAPPRARSPGPGMPRAASPQPQQIMRARSPGPGMMRAASPQPPQNNMRARSPGPGMMRARSPGPQMMMPPPRQQESPHRFQEGSPYPRIGNGGRNSGGRPSSSMGMEMQLSNGQQQTPNSMGNARPSSAYGGSYFPQQPQPQQQQQHQSQSYDPRDAQGQGQARSQMKRERSKSMGPVPSIGRNAPPPGVLHYGKLSVFHPLPYPQLTHIVHSTSAVFLYRRDPRGAHLRQRRHPRGIENAR